MILYFLPAVLFFICSFFGLIGQVSQQLGMVHGKFLGLKLNSSSSLGHGAPDLLVHDLQSSAHHRDYGCRWTDLIQKGCTGVFLLRSKVFKELCLASSLLSGEEAHALSFQTKAPLCFPPRITNGIVAFESIPFPNNG